MKKLLPNLLLFYPCFCFAQSKIEYANFIQTDTAVKWASIYSSYVNLSPVNPNFNLRNFYINKLKKQAATAYLEEANSFAVTPVKLDYTQYKETIRQVNYNAVKMNWLFNYDEKNDASEKIMQQESNECDTCALRNKLSFFKVKQLLYYKDNQFKIQNILLSPVIYKKEAQGSKEDTKYFEAGNFAFNEIKNADAPVPATAKFIGRACNKLLLLPTAALNSSENNILTLNNWSLAAQLYKDVKKKILRVYDTDKSIYPDPKNVLNYRKIEEYKNSPLIIPVYDSTGEVHGSKTIIPEINFDSLYNFTLIQDFYFDFNKEILYSKLVALVPSMSVVTSQGIYLGLTNYWGVIFPEEKKKAIKKTK